MSGPGLTFGNLGWLLPVVALWLAGIAASVWAYRRALLLDPHGRVTARAGLGLRLFGLTIVALALLEPGWARPRARPGANQLAVLVDGSRSLRLPDAQGRPRTEALKGQLADDPAWLRALGEIYQLRRYRFDARLERLSDFEGIGFEGSASHLGMALATLGDRFKGAPLAGVVLLTDGNATDLADAEALRLAVKDLPPVYPVVLGGDRTGRDVAVAQVTASETLFEDAPVNIDAHIEAVGLRGRALTVELRDERDQVVETRALTPAADEVTETVRFRVKPPPPPAKPATPGNPSAAPPGPAPGGHHRVVVTAREPLDEATLANNARSVVVPRPRGAARLLYVGGRPNWEHKFLARAVEGDRLLELVSLVRLAPREPKFAFLTRKGESVNPLYRGFGASADDAERFDEAVLLRLGTRDAAELRGGFPKTAEELFAYHAVILDDVEAGFFTAAQQALVERFVAERGGGFLMLGGLASFRQGGYDRTPIGDLVPVYLDRSPEAAPPTPARFSLSREGWLEAWARLRDNEAAERARLDAMPPFKITTRTRGLKPGASVLATFSSGKTEHPALVVQRAGEGRSAALTVGDLWRWGLRRAPGEPDDLAKFWRQTLRALVADVPRPVTLALAPRAADADAFTVRATVRGRNFRPADGARVAISAVAPDGSRTALNAEPSTGAPGVYEAVWRPSAAGVHRVEVHASGADGQPLGEAVLGRAFDRDADEHRSVRPNLALLGDIAQRTGGAVIGIDGLPGLAERLRDRPAPVNDLEVRPLWHTWLVLLLALACLLGEWTLRRRRGLP